MKRKFYVYVFLSFTVAYSYAGPGTYYNSIDTNQTCAALKTLLFHLIASNTTVIPYASVDNYYNLTDMKPAESGGGDVIVDRYCSENPYGLDYCSFRYPSGFCLTTPSDTSPCVCYNKEHTFPKSWFGGVNVYPMYSDMHVIWPADNRINYYKDNYPLGYVKHASYSSKNGTLVGTSDNTRNYGYLSSNVFEPIDSFKGDFARAYLYEVTRYQDSLPFWPGRSTSSEVLDGSKYPGLKSWILQLCVKWNKLDPPSAFEMQRNDAVYALQGNRNPYIDHPNWVEKVFGVDGISGNCVSLGIREHSADEFLNLYPNPANNQLSLAWMHPAAHDEGRFEVLDVLGKKWYREEWKEGQHDRVIDIHELPKGTYFVRFVSGDTEAIRTFLKQ